MLKTIVKTGGYGWIMSLYSKKPLFLRYGYESISGQAVKRSPESKKTCTTKAANTIITIDFFIILS